MYSHFNYFPQCKHVSHTWHSIWYLSLCLWDLMATNMENKGYNVCDKEPGNWFCSHPSLSKSDKRPSDTTFYKNNTTVTNYRGICPSKRALNSNEQSSVLKRLCLIALLIYLISRLRDKCVSNCLKRFSVKLSFLLQKYFVVWKIKF